MSFSYFWSWFSWQANISLWITKWINAKKKQKKHLCFSILNVFLLNGFSPSLHFLLLVPVVLEFQNQGFPVHEINMQKFLTFLLKWHTLKEKGIFYHHFQPFPLCLLVPLSFPLVPRPRLGQHPPGKWTTNWVITVFQHPVSHQMLKCLSNEDKNSTGSNRVLKKTFKTLISVIVVTNLWIHKTHPGTFFPCRAQDL